MGYKYFNISACLLIASMVIVFGNPKITSATETVTAAPIPHQLELKWDGGLETIDENTIGRWMNQKNTLLKVRNYTSEIENIEACPVEDVFLCDLLLTSKSRHELRLTSQYEVSEEPIRSFLKNLSAKINTEPIDAKFSVENERVTVFSPEQKGRKLDIEESTKEIIAILSSGELDSKSLELKVSVSDPLVSAAEANSLGIATLIGQGKSNFRGSTKSRIHNIKTAIKKFNGVLIKPGEEFSFVQTLGEVDGENGYLPELVIKKDKTEPEFGGGICQVSTTTFRAAIYSGLKITARKNHAYPVSYYNPQGMDSTIYVPKPDLKFVNNTPGYILIQNRIEGTELIFDFYGTNDGRKIEVEGPRIIERNPDGSMKTTFTQTVFDAQGNTLIKDIFNSSYDSPAKYPHPVDPSTITEKPKDWSQKQWENFKKTGILPTT